MPNYLITYDNEGIEEEEIISASDSETARNKFWISRDNKDDDIQIICIELELEENLPFTAKDFV